MKIYHGGFTAVEKPVIREGAYNKDFGQGFYCTEFQTQAERWAKRFETPAVSVYEYSLKSGDVVQKLGESEIKRLLELADILHCEPIEVTANDLITKRSITTGSFDNIAMCKYAVPTHFDIAKVYKRLAANLAETRNMAIHDALIQVYTSWISEKIDDYNSSMYFESPQYLYESYIAGKALTD